MTTRSIIGILVLLVVSVCTVRAELSLEELRGKFESALESEKLEYGVKVLKLRDGYLGALEQLKNTLGKEEKLEQAAQVLAEIELVKQANANAAVADLPESADFRLKNLRGQWEKQLEKYAAEQKQSIADLAGKYFKILEDRKRSLTRAGEIREALRVESEVKRVEKIPEIKAAVDSQQDIGNGREEAEREGNKADDEISGTRWEFYANGTKRLGVIHFESATSVVFSWRENDKIKWERLDARRLTLTELRVKEPKVFTMVIDRNGKTFTLHRVGQQIGNGHKVLPEDEGK